MRQSTPMVESELQTLPLIHRGKVRDLYAIDDSHLLFVATDRLSAFDVVLPDPIPGKGAVLTRLSVFWFNLLADLVPNHLSTLPLEAVVPDPKERSAIADRALVVKRLKPLPLEAIARGYLIGSGWRDYQRTGTVCGVHLPAGLQQADRLPTSIYTPSTKAARGEHDANIDFEATVDAVGRGCAEEIRRLTIALYERAAAHAARRGILIADTKFEFGLDSAGRITLMDEVLTPDSSRFWPADTYSPGQSPDSFDKQYVRNYLESLNWNQQPPGPPLPAEVIAGTAARYAEAERRLVGPEHGSASGR